MVRSYEIYIRVNPNLEDSTPRELILAVGGVLEELGGKVVSIVEIGRRGFAFPPPARPSPTNSYDFLLAFTLRPDLVNDFRGECNYLTGIMYRDVFVLSGVVEAGTYPDLVKNRLPSIF
jgi:ribosomal protein S6